MKNISLFFFVFLFFGISSFGQRIDLHIPATTEQCEITHHLGFSLLYNASHKQSQWVAYQLTKHKVLTREAERSDRFIPDPKISNTNFLNDYRGSGYDRGHLAPAADMNWSKDAMDQSFYFSNMSPQTPAFNRGIWAKLEKLVRDWAFIYDTIYVATGPVLADGLPSIGQNNISVPEYYYKVILVHTSSRKQGIGFILANNKSSESLDKFAVSIDSVQRFTGIDFFYQLPDSIETMVESNFSTKEWDWFVSGSK